MKIDKIDKKVLLSIVTAAMLSFIGILSETALNVSFPTLMNEFNILSSDVQWLTSGYLLVVAVLVPVSPTFVKRFDTTKLFSMTTLIFIIGTLVCGFAPSFPILLVGRVIQAISTGISMPLMFNIVLELVPKSKRGVVMGMVGMVISFSPAIGPTYGGIVTTALSWHWIFFLEIPVLILIVVLGKISMSNISKNEKTKFDILSLFLSAVAFSTIIAGFSFAGELGWSNFKVIGLFIIGVITLLWFGKRQLSISNPLLNLSPFKYPMFSIAVALTCVIMFIELGLSFLIPNLSANLLLVNTTIAGLIMLPAATTNALLSPFTGRYLDKHGARNLIITGITIISIALGLFIYFVPSLTITKMVLIYILVMMGVSMVYMPSQTHGLNQLPMKYNADGTAIVNTIMQVAGAMGTALVANILASNQSLINQSSGLIKLELIQNNATNCFILLLVVGLIGCICAFFIKDNKTGE